MDFQLLGSRPVDGGDVRIHARQLLRDEYGHLFIRMGNLHQVGSPGTDFGFQHLILGAEFRQHGLRDFIAFIGEFFRCLRVVLHFNAAICGQLQNIIADNPFSLLQQSRIVIPVGRGRRLPQDCVQQQGHLL